MAARWQMSRMGLRKGELEVVRQRFPKVARGVYAIGELDEYSAFMAAALAYGPNAVISHISALMVLGLRPIEPGDIHVSVPHTGVRRTRPGIEIHRRKAMSRERAKGIPVTSPTQSVRDANLAPFELYRALEEAEKRGWSLDLPASDVLRLKAGVQGYTRSDAEAMFLLLCHAHGLPLPLVNHRVHGILTDFHWPQARLVVEVDGWEFHKERPQFEEDRRRGLVHASAGETVIRASASHVQHHPGLVADAVRRGLTGAPLLAAA